MNLHLLKWFGETYANEIEDIARHGIDAGYADLCYTSDLVEIHDRFESQLWECLGDLADDGGYSSIMAFLADCRCAEDSNRISNLKGAIVWIVFEDMAFRIAERMDDLRGELDWESMETEDQLELLEKYGIELEDIDPDSAPPELLVQMVLSENIRDW